METPTTSSNTVPANPNVLIIPAFKAGGHFASAQAVRAACEKLGCDVTMHVAFSTPFQDDRLRESFNKFDDHKDLNDKNLDDPKNRGLISPEALEVRKYLRDSEEWKKEWNAIKDVIKAKKPDVIFINGRWMVAPANEIRASLEEKFPSIVIQAPDHGPPHRSWTQRLEEKNDYVVASGETACDGFAKDPHFFPLERILKGYPVRKAFEEVSGISISKEEARRQCGLREDQEVLLITGGSDSGAYSKEKLPKIVEKVTQDERFNDLQIVVVAGSNKDVEADLKKRFSNKARICGNLDEGEMALFMRAATVVGTKPGGGTLGECYTMGKIPLIYPTESLLERDNASHAKENNLGKCVSTPEIFCDTLHDILKDKDGEKTKILAAQKKYVIPESAENIAKLLCNLARQPNLHNRPAQEIVSQTPGESLSMVGSHRNQAGMFPDGNLGEQDAMQVPQRQSTWSGRAGETRS